MRSLLFVAILIFTSASAWAQCNPYYVIKEGMKLETTSFNAKDKQEGRSVTIIDSYNASDNGWEAVMSMKTFDKKDKLVYEQDKVEMSCADGTIHLNMDRFIPQESMDAFKSMNMKLEVDNIEIPSDLKVGMMLDEGSIKISGDLPMTMTTTITNRKVEAEESITTPAGTFDCYKISYEIAMKSIMSRTMKGVEWIAKDVGVVRTESYNKGGKMIGYSLLTKVDK